MKKIIDWYKKKFDIGSTSDFFFVTTLLVCGFVWVVLLVVWVVNFIEVMFNN